MEKKYELVVINIANTGDFLYSLDGSVFQSSNRFRNVIGGLYRVYVKTQDCPTLGSTEYLQFYIPKYFTPNNDGYHDTWQIYGVSEMFQPNTKIQIFNRFGKLLKELNPLGEGWNGQLNGYKLPTDDYWFSIRLQDGRVYKNHFTLIN